MDFLAIQLPGDCDKSAGIRTKHLLHRVLAIESTALRLASLPSSNFQAVRGFRLQPDQRREPCVADTHATHSAKFVCIHTLLLYGTETPPRTLNAFAMRCSAPDAVRLAQTVGWCRYSRKNVSEILMRRSAGCQTFAVVSLTSAMRTSCYGVPNSLVL